MAESHAQRLVRVTHGRSADEILRELYVEKRHSQEEIARSLGVTRTTVAAWLRDYGISRDDRKPVTL
jgi:transcriptional regulator of aromatic amino acid metabolism